MKQNAFSWKFVGPNLSRRIKGSVFMAVLLTVVFFLSGTTYLTARLARQNGSFFASMFAQMLSERLASPDLLKAFEVDSLLEITPNSVQANMIRQEALRIGTRSFSVFSSGDQITTYSKNTGSQIIAVPDPANTENYKTLMFQDIAQFRIVIGDKSMFESANWGTDLFLVSMGIDTTSPAFSKISDYFSLAATSIIPGTDNLPVGRVEVRLDSGFMFTSYLGLIIGIVISAAACVLLALLLSGFLSKTVTLPIRHLNNRLYDLASSSSDDITHVSLKFGKPVYEIQTITEATNTIIDKMRTYNQNMVAQRSQLEAQNLELESQNSELEASRQQIKNAQTQLIQNQNMASVGQLTAAISHEINTPLGTINSNVQLQNMILDMLAKESAVMSDAELSNIIAGLQEASKLNIFACDKVAGIIRSLKNFSRLDQADFQESDINDSARSVVLLTSNLWKKRIRVHESYADLPRVKCYPGLLNQVLMNLMVNAIHAIEQDGDIWIETAIREMNVVVTVRDNGIGISPENLPHIFENGFTTKKQSEGSGLGLSICDNIIQKHGGKIYARSQVGVGTEFEFTIPVINTAT